MMYLVNFGKFVFTPKTVSRQTVVVFREVAQLHFFFQICKVWVIPEISGVLACLYDYRNEFESK